MKVFSSLAILALVNQGAAIKVSHDDIYGGFDNYDADGDGVQDNAHRTRDQLDDFFYPNVMGDAGMDVYNTQHGDLPGHVQKEFEDRQTAPEDTYTLKRAKWNNI